MTRDKLTNKPKNIMNFRTLYNAILRDAVLIEIRGDNKTCKSTSFDIEQNEFLSINEVNKTYFFDMDQSCTINSDNSVIVIEFFSNKSVTLTFKEYETINLIQELNYLKL